MAPVAKTSKVTSKAAAAAVTTRSGTSTTRPRAGTPITPKTTATPPNKESNKTRNASAPTQLSVAAEIGLANSFTGLATEAKDPHSTTNTSQNPHSTAKQLIVGILQQLQAMYNEA